MRFVQFRLVRSIFIQIQSIASAAVILISLSAYALPNPQDATSASELQLGVQAYKDSRYDVAIHHFQRAVESDSCNVNARMYLATTYTQEYIPGVDDPDNVALATKAITQFKEALNCDPNALQRANSLKGLASLNYNMKNFDESKEYSRELIQIDPDDPDPYYSIGVIDWTTTYRLRMEGRVLLGLRPEDHLDAANKDQKKLCDELIAKNSDVVAEGIEMLKKAIELRPDYDDAMAYMNLMYREKADLECDDPAARDQDLKTADEWVDKTLSGKKAKVKKAEREAAQQNQPEKQ